MKRALLFSIAIAFPSLIGAASFDCSKAASKNELAICSDPELSSLDEVLAATYKQTRSIVTDTKKLRNEQVNWIKSVATCEGNVDCLIGAYRDRIRVIDYVDGVLSVLNDPLQDRIEELNEREELIALQENALTTEIRALNSAIEQFEEDKLAFAKQQKIAVSKQEEETPAPKSVTQTTPAAPQKTRLILPEYQSEYFIYQPCDKAPTNLSESDLQAAIDMVRGAIYEYNDQPNVDMIMEYPIKAACLTSVGKPSTLLAGSISINFYVDYDHFVCLVVNENCQGRRMGYQAGIYFKKNNQMQVTVNTYRFEDAINHCYQNGVKRNGNC